MAAFTTSSTIALAKYFFPLENAKRNASANVVARYIYWCFTFGDVEKGRDQIRWKKIWRHGEPGK